MPLLAHPSKRPDRLKMIEQALKDKNPTMYLQLRRSKKLQQFLSDQEEAMMESFLEAYSQAKSEILGPKGPKDHQEIVQQLTMADHEAWSDALSKWLEFPTTESNPVTSTKQAERSTLKKRLDSSESLIQRYQKYQKLKDGPEWDRVPAEVKQRINRWMQRMEEVGVV